MKIKIILLLIVIGCSAPFFSCKKYPEGPYFSLRSKAARLHQNWKLVQYFRDGIDRTTAFMQPYSTYQFNINKDGTMNIHTESYMPQNGSTHIVQVNGKWQLNDKKTDVIFNEEYVNDNDLPQPVLSGIRHDYIILKLTEKELGLQENIITDSLHENKYYFNQN